MTQLQPVFKRGAIVLETISAFNQKSNDRFCGVREVIEAHGLFSSFYRDPAYSTEARGRSECASGTHQGRLPFELAAAGITGMETANCYPTKTGKRTTELGNSKRKRDRFF